MAPRSNRKQILLWAAIATVAASIVLALGIPTSGLWRCFVAFNNGERAVGEVVSIPEDGPAVVRFGDVENPRSCVVGRGDLPEELAAGDSLAVVLDARYPERCTTEEALSAVQSALTGLAAVVVSLLLGLVLVGLRVQRSLSQPRPLTSERVRESARSRADASLACPNCEKPMTEGYLPLVAGIHWREKDEPAGLPHALGGLEGTVGWPRPASLHALRCEACEVVLFRYGKRPRR